MEKTTKVIMKTNIAGIDLIKKFEGLKLEAYPDPATGGDPWTIGYGHTSAAGLPNVVPGLTITKKEAEDILIKDLSKFEKGVIRNLKVDVNENQFSSLVSFAFNVGIGSFSTSTLLKKLNDRDHTGAAHELDRWVYGAGKVMKGLVRRRKAEKALFLSSSDRDVYVLALQDTILKSTPVQSALLAASGKKEFIQGTFIEASLLDENQNHYQLKHDNHTWYAFCDHVKVVDI